MPVAVAPDILDDQVARPVASEVRISPAAGLPPVILICQLISSLAPGVDVPIPILDPEL